MIRHQELEFCCHPSRTCLSQEKPFQKSILSKSHETGVGRGRTALKRTAQTPQHREKTFLLGKQDLTWTLLQTARRLKVPEKEISLMLFKAVWLYMLTRLSEQYVHMLAEQSTCTCGCRNVRYHKVLNRDDNRRILLQITFFFAKPLFLYLNWNPFLKL